MYNIITDKVMLSVLEFIHRRFSEESEWLNKNCYYFAVILKERFCNLHSEIYIDIFDEHFICKIEDTFYDCRGVVKYTDDYINKYIKKWSTYHNEDIVNWERILKSVVM